MNDNLTQRIKDLIHKNNSLRSLSMENLLAFEGFIKKNIYQDYEVLSDDTVSVLASKSHYKGITYNPDIYRIPDEQYCDLIEAKINQLSLHDSVNQVMLNIIKYLARSDDQKKSTIYRSVKETFGTNDIHDYEDLMHCMRFELFSYVYGTDREKHLLAEELKYFQLTTESIFKKLKSRFGDRITDSELTD